MAEKTPAKTSKPKRALLSHAVQAQQPTPTTPRSTETGEATAQKQRSGRVGTKMLGGHFSEPAQRQFKVLAAEQGKTVQVLLEEALKSTIKSR
jgi:hypothetical protein